MSLISGISRTQFYRLRDTTVLLITLHKVLPADDTEGSSPPAGNLFVVWYLLSLFRAEFSSADKTERASPALLN